jgi:hypothetical protein
MAHLLSTVMTRALNGLSSDTKLNAQGVSLPLASNLQELFQQLPSNEL